MSRYQAYPEYKESGVESIGAIPSEWQVWKWKHLLLSPMTYGANEAALDDNRNHPRYIRITDMNADGTLRDDSFKSLTPIVARDYLLQDGDILVARTGATVGKSFLYKREFGTSCYAGYLIRARVNQKIVSPKFVYWYMQSDQYWKFISGSQIQATIQNVSAEKYGDMEFAVPDLTAFCEKIANFLDHETAKIDTLIAKQQELIKLLKEKRQAVISHAVTKGLNPNAPMRDSGVEWLGEVPAHWIVSRLKFNCCVKGRIGFRGYTVEDLVEGDDGALVLGASEMTLSGELVLDSCPSISWKKYYESPEIMLKAGMLLFVQRGSTVGKVAYVPDGLGPATINPSLIVLRDIRMRPIFLTYCLMSSSIQTLVKIQTSTTAIPMISQEQVGNYWQCIPPIEEQVQIENYIQDQLTKLDSAINTAQKSIELSMERRTALISAAVTGKIDVRDWQAPSDVAIAA